MLNLYIAKEGYLYSVSHVLQDLSCEACAQAGVPCSGPVFQNTDRRYSFAQQAWVSGGTGDGCEEVWRDTEPNSQVVFVLAPDHTKAIALIAAWECDRSQEDNAVWEGVPIVALQ